MIPKYKIVTKTGGVTDYTIESDCLALFFKETLTDGVGGFSFTLPTMKGVDYVYHDIAPNDTVEMYVGYDTVPATASFKGKIGKIEGAISNDGVVRRISGLSQGEVLLARHKTNVYYKGSNAGLMVAVWAGELGLGADIDADANQPTIEVKTKTYFDLLREISDYWIDAGNQIKKDFYVNVDNELVWKTRPFRTAGVETLTVGENVLDYVVTQLKDRVRNNITVYGSADKPRPLDKDGYTDTIDDWTASVGTVDVNAAAPKVGTNTIRAYTGAGADQSTFKRDIPKVNIRDINTLYFWSYTGASPTTGKVRLHAPNNANYFEANLTVLGNTWYWNELPLGPQAIYDAATNPNGTWTEAAGVPNWWNIEYVEFDFVYGANDRYTHIDGMWFYPDRWSDTTSDAGSITSYDQRDLEVTDDKLHTDSACEQRAETLLYQLKDAPTQIDLTAVGNNNILVGDRISMTIPAENISAVNFDVTTVENTFSPTGWVTRATMVNSGNIRGSIVTSPTKRLRELSRRVRGAAAKEEMY